MNKKKINCLIYLTFSFLLCFLACTKQSDLEQPIDTSLSPMKNMDDAQAILDNTNVIGVTPTLSEISADNFYIPDTSLLGMVEMNAYLWKQDIFDTRPVMDWNKSYEQVYYANSVLDKFSSLSTNNPIQTNRVLGSAYFIRGYAFFNVALQFSNLYDSMSAESNPGIPLRLTSDLLPKSVRATVAQTYQQIIRDINEAIRWLPPIPDPVRKNRPSLPAAYALLARVYLSMNDYQKAKLYADNCLMIYSKLLDYNMIDRTLNNPFGRNNEEVLFQSHLDSSSKMLYPGYFYIDSSLYESYSDQDLRKSLFFSLGNAGLPISRNGYSGDITRFSGLAVDEVLLIRAECKSRLQDQAGALQDLVTLLRSRWRNGAYTLPAVSTPNEVLQLILTERRKELVFRGIRWADIRRLNKLGAGITLQRMYRQQLYTLSPGDIRYVLPIPPDVIAISGMEQNPR